MWKVPPARPSGLQAKANASPNMPLIPHCLSRTRLGGGCGLPASDTRWHPPRGPQQLGARGSFPNARPALSVRWVRGTAMAMAVCLHEGCPALPAPSGRSTCLEWCPPDSDVGSALGMCVTLGILLCFSKCVFLHVKPVIMRITGSL